AIHSRRGWPERGRGKSRARALKLRVPDVSGGERSEPREPSEPWTSIFHLWRSHAHRTSSVPMAADLTSFDRQTSGTRACRGRRGGGDLWRESRQSEGAARAALERSNHVIHAKASEQRAPGPRGFTPRGPTRASESEASRERSKSRCERSKMRATGLEPARVLPHGNLNPVRLPIPPRPRRRRLYEKRPLSRFPSFVPTGDLPRSGSIRNSSPFRQFAPSFAVLVRVRHPPPTPSTGNSSIREKP
ncbi:MAG: hypothetical protein RIR10_1812, partial [Planctomycetota bacterium]